MNLDHAKVAISFGFEPHSPEAYRLLDAIHSLHRDSYIAEAMGLSMEPGGERKSFWFWHLETTRKN